MQTFPRTKRTRALLLTITLAALLPAMLLPSTRTATAQEGGDIVPPIVSPSSVNNNYFVHRATPNNTGGHVTTISNPLTDNQPGVALFVTQTWNPGGSGGIYNPHNIGVYYTNGKWTIFNQDFAPMPSGAAFNVTVLTAEFGAFVHRATGGSSQSPIDNPATNNQPNKIVFATSNFNPSGGGGGYNNHPHAVAYGTGANRWRIENQDGAAIPANAAFNVVAYSNGASITTHTVTSANRTGNYTYIDNPSANGNPNANIQVTANTSTDVSTTNDPRPVGVFYDPGAAGGTGRWAIFNEDTTAAMPIGAVFNIWVQAAPQLGNGKIAYGSTTTGEGDDIYVMNPDGGGNVNLTNSPEEAEFDPAWSPDGSHIAFARDRNLYTINSSNGTNERHLHAADSEVTSPQWSPDGSKIVFAALFGGSGNGIFTVNSDGTNLTRLTSDAPPMSDASPTWSPDGTRIAFSRFNPSGSTRTSDIFVMNSDGTGQTALTANNPGIDDDPAWFGTKIAFSSVRSANGALQQIYVMNADGTAPTALTFSETANNARPSWSTDGSQIVYEERVPNTATHIKKMTATGGSQTRISSRTMTERTPAWGSVQNGLLRFASTSQFVIENAGKATLTVQRTGDTTQPASVSYATIDDQRLFNCNPQTTGDPSGLGAIPGVATARCDYSTTVGTLNFGPYQTSKTFDVPFVDDVHVEGRESLTVRLTESVGDSLGTQTEAVVFIEDNDTTVGQPNPINPQPNNNFFVRQHYLDFFGRIPADSEVQGWVNNIQPDCGLNQQCFDRLWVSGIGFFQSQEFQQKGYFVYRMYKLLAAGGTRKPTYREFIPDMVSLAGTGDADKNFFVQRFMARADFETCYGGTSNSDFVARLVDASGTPGSFNQSQMIADLDNRTKTRAQLVRDVAENAQVYQRYFTEAGVVMSYFGFLRRDGAESEYNSWLSVLNANPNDYRTMTDGFVRSTEYRQRFGQP